jgi:hypothetical protein
MHYACHMQGGRSARPCHRRCSQLAATSNGILHAEAEEESEEEEEEEEEGGEYASEAPLAVQPSTSYDTTGDEESRSFALAMAKIAWDTKGEEVMVLHGEGEGRVGRGLQG